MKKILLILIILISLTACESKKNNSIEKNEAEYAETTSDSETVLTELEKEEKQNKGTYNPDQKFECVFVKVGDKAKLRVVKTGIQDDTNIEIMEGLKKGEEIITGPYLMVSKDLNTNDKVKVQSKKDDKAKK